MGCVASKGDQAEFVLAYESGDPLARKLRTVYDEEMDDLWRKGITSSTSSNECSVPDPCDSDEASALAYHFCAYIDRRHKEKRESGSASVLKAEPGCIAVKIHSRSGRSQLRLTLTITYTVLDLQKMKGDEARYEKIREQLKCNQDYFLARADAKVETVSKYREGSFEVPIYKNCASLKGYFQAGLDVLANDLSKEVYKSSDDLGYFAGNTTTKSQKREKSSCGEEATLTDEGEEKQKKAEDEDFEEVPVYESAAKDSGDDSQKQVSAYTILQAEKDLVAFRDYAEQIWESGSPSEGSVEAGKKWRTILDKPQISWIILHGNGFFGSSGRVLTTIKLTASSPRYGSVLLNLRGDFDVPKEAYEEQVSDYDSFVKEFSS